MAATIIFVLAFLQQSPSEISLGDPVQGTVNDSSTIVQTPTLDANYTTAPTKGISYTFAVPQTGNYFINLHSFSFDAYLVLKNAAGELIAEDDDSLLRTHSQLAVRLNAGTDYQVTACALHGKRGDFELLIAAGNPNKPLPKDEWNAEALDRSLEIEFLSQTDGPKSESVCKAIKNLANLNYQNGSYQDSLSGFEKLLAIREETVGSENLEVGEILNSIAFLHRALDDSKGGIPYAERALAVRQNSVGQKHAQVASSLDLLGTLYQSIGDLAKAKNLLNESLAIYKEIAGEDSLSAGTAIASLASIHSDLAEFEKANELYLQAFAIFENSYGPDHLQTALLSGNYGLFLGNIGDATGSEPWLRRAYEACLKILGPDHPNTSISLANFAISFVNQGRYQEAIPLFESALVTSKKQFGPRHPSTALTLNNLATALFSAGRRPEALPIMEEVVSIYEEAYGSDSPQIVFALDGLATMLNDSGKMDRALELLQRALAITEKTLGREHPDVANILSNIWTNQMARGKLNESKSLAEREIKILAKAYGPENARTATAYEHLGETLQAMGDKEGALTHFELSLKVRMKVQGMDHPDTSRSLISLGDYYLQNGNIDQALKYLQPALLASEKLLGPNHPQVATICSQMGNAYRSKGQLGEARSALERCLQINEELLGEDHIATAKATGNLALLLMEFGNLEEAEKLFRRTLDIMIKVEGRDGLQVAVAMSNYALFLIDRGDLEAARPLNMKALAIIEKVFGPGHSKTSTSLNNLALQFEAEGNLPEALKYLQRAQGILEKTKGPEHPATAHGLGNLAVLLLNMGDKRAALPLQERALAIMENTFGTGHYATTSAMKNLALIHQGIDNHVTALDLFIRSIRSSMDHLDRELPNLTEAGRLQLLRLSSNPENLIASNFKQDGSRTEEVYAVFLQWKGKATRLLQSNIQMGRIHLSDEMLAKKSRMQILSKSLSQLIMLPLSEQETGHSQMIGEMRQERLALERDLNRALKLDQVLATPTVQEIQAQMDPGTVLLDFFVGRSVFVWILPSEGPPRMGHLASTEELTELQAEFLAASALRGGRTLGAEEVDPGKEFFDLVWAPLVEAVGDAETVIICPDGFLCELPFGILQEADGSYLLEKHKFLYLADATQAALVQARAADKEGSLLAVGGVNYFRRDEAPTDSSKESATSTRSRIGSSWSSLPSTRDELRTLNDLHDFVLEWQAPMAVVEGKAATEERIRKELPGKRYIHIATHGYFEPDHLPSLLLDAEEKQAKAELGEQIQAVGLLPGLLSGLVFAGVNGEPDPNRDDGYLSAEEIQYLDLSACDMVVLSACETALGSARAGEGLMSLRRSFSVAGAETVVSSLWKVDDQATAVLMKDFYTNLWAKGMPGGDALHQAKLRMLRRNRMENAGDAMPHTWGAFVLSGNWK
ncbi:MAG: tetratricopeptide repeat protein [Planctomycetes bacterium]|nr:tetratricopeptide repeat protein [Planctomycetota bacterium]